MSVNNREIVALTLHAVSVDSGGAYRPELAIPEA